MVDLLRRYFVANRARILSVRRLNLPPVKFLRCNTGNSGGFYWGRWQVTWRKPYSRVWAFHAQSRQWVPAYTIRESQHA